MTDTDQAARADELIKQLRATATSTGLCYRAADEITRLRAERDAAVQRAKAAERKQGETARERDYYWKLMCKRSDALAAERAARERMRDTFCEIANRAGNMMDKDAASWMPSIFKIACEAAGEDPWRMLRAAGYTPETLTVSMSDAAPAEASAGEAENPCPVCGWSAGPSIRDECCFFPEYNCPRTDLRFCPARPAQKDSEYD
jgi:hypothetical protein